MKLSILVPVYNEVDTIKLILKRLEEQKLKVPTEIIVIDDGSTDGTTSVLKNFKTSKIKKVFQEKNSGKGTAIKTGIDNATGDYVLIQDADLEYDPSQIPQLLEPILSKKADVVYGTRLDRMPNFAKDEKTPLFLIHYFGNRFLSLVTSMLYGQWITDMETGYKLFPKRVFKNQSITSKGFELEPEITAKLINAGYKIFEVPISTNPRGYDKGKKLQARKEGIKAIIALVKYKLI